MKALLLIGAAALLAVGVTTSPKISDPDSEAVALAALIDNVASGGKYTKQTTIHLKSETQAEAQEYFHAGAFSLTRTTYYDENADALLMCNSTTKSTMFSSINSGYAKQGDDMVHFSRDTDGVTAENLFDSEAYNVDYTVEDTTPKTFFVMLTSIADEIRSGNYDFDYEGGIYTYDFHNDPLTFDENGHYANALLHKVQYFVAPLLLESVAGESHYLTPEKMEFVSTIPGVVAMRLIASSSDAAKLDEMDHAIATAFVYNGLIISD